MENIARRYNKGKLRYELISQIGLKKLAEVYTKGAEKYTLYDDKGNLIEDGANNWRKGMSWMSTIASVKRHIEQWQSGEDIDADLGTEHLANAAWGLFTLLDYKTNYPQGDDRNHKYLNFPKIGLDIDDVLADYIPYFSNIFGLSIPVSWEWGYKFEEKFKELFSDLDNAKKHYLNIPVKTPYSEIPFEPHCYITSRSVPKEWTKEWIEKNGFPCKKVYSIPFETSKVEVAKESGIDIFVDDKYENFIELNKAGVCCYLFDAPHNAKYDVGYKRIKSLNDLKFLI